MRKLISKHVALIILIAVILILTVIFFEDHFPPFHPAGTFKGALWAYSLKFVDHLGIAVLSIGLVGLLLELPHWQGHFHKYMVATITDKEYLKKFSDPELNETQTKLMKVFFKTEDIDKEDSFFRYYREKIQGFIGKPYREGTTGLTKVSYSDDGKTFVVEETISFECRRLGKDIQSEAKWTTAKDEIDDIIDFRITVTVPPAVAQHYPEVPQKRVFDKNDDPDSQLKEITGKWGYNVSLEEYRGIDGLEVKLEVKYVVALDRAFSWTMPYISKGLNCKITFPLELKIFTDQFVMEDVEAPDASQPGVCVYRYPYWLLPGDGLAFHFRKQN